MSSAALLSLKPLHVDFVDARGNRWSWLRLGPLARIEAEARAAAATVAARSGVRVRFEVRS